MAHILLIFSDPIIYLLFRTQVYIFEAFFVLFASTFHKKINLELRY